MDVGCIGMFACYQGLDFPISPPRKYRFEEEGRSSPQPVAFNFGIVPCVKDNPVAVVTKQGHLGFYSYSLTTGLLIETVAQQDVHVGFLGNTTLCYL